MKAHEFNHYSPWNRSLATKSRLFSYLLFISIFSLFSIASDRWRDRQTNCTYTILSNSRRPSVGVLEARAKRKKESTLNTVV